MGPPSRTRESISLHDKDILCGSQYNKLDHAMKGLYASYQIPNISNRHEMSRLIICALA